MALAVQDTVAPVVSASELSSLQQAVDSFNREQLIWSSGFLAGLAGTQPALAPVENAATDEWQIFYATETGNSRRLAENLASNATAAGLSTSIQDLRDVRPKVLKNTEHAIFVLATHGLGEAPEGSEAFFEFWFSDRAPQLNDLTYSILALGDSSYADFCEIGRQFDARLRELGATALVERVDCDLDFEATAARWSEQVVEKAEKQASTAQRPPSVHLTAVPDQAGYNRTRPYTADIVARQKITGHGSSKDVRHIELDLEGSGLRYEPGDSIGVISKNPPQLIDALLDVTQLDGDKTVDLDGKPTSLCTALTSDKEITALSRSVLEAVAGSHPQLHAILDSRDSLSDYLNTRQLIDLLHEFPRDWQAQEFVDVLRGLTPRLYSISSSPDANPDEAHLTVAVVRYDAFGRQHWGSASNFLAADSTNVPVYVEPNDRFRLPNDTGTPIIMVGAGTGIAPYRAFVEHRREHGHAGKNWLFFGDRNFSSDFLYQLEWLRYRKEGLLTNLDVAFSRDQAEKVYVQHRLLNKGAEVYDWLESGANFYVCGDMTTLAPDVDRALHAIVREHGKLSDDKAKEYVANLKQAARYQRDVY